MVAAAAVLCAAILGASPTFAQSAGPSSQQTEALAPAKLLERLRHGGYVLYFRHAATNFTENDAHMRDFDDCANQRNLSDPGRDAARKIGLSIRALRIPIGKVSSSPYCRTVETAELAFGRTAKLHEARYGATGEKQDPYADLRKMLQTRPVDATNDVIVSHGNPFYRITGGLRLAEGEIAVVAPQGNRFEVVGRIRPEDWAALRAADGR